MIKRILLFISTLLIFVLIALILKSGEIKISAKRYSDKISFELNNDFVVEGLLTLDSLPIVDSIFQNKLTLVQFSYNACGACRRDKQLFPDILKKTPEEFQLLIISIDNYNYWRKINNDQNRWQKVNIGDSDLRKQLQIESYPTYFVVDSDSKIISRPNDGLAFIRNYYNIKTTTSISVFKDYVIHLKETKRFWNYIFSFLVIYIIILGSIFCIVSIILSIRFRLFSKKILLIWSSVYILVNILFFNLIYFTDGREEIRRVNTKNHHMLGEFFSMDSLNIKYPDNPVSFEGRTTLINFFHMKSPICMLEICSVPNFLKSMPDSIQVLSFAVNDYKEYQTNIHDTVFLSFNITTMDSSRWSIDYNVDTSRWRQFHVSELGSFVNNLEIGLAPVSILVDSDGRIIERPTSGIKFMGMYDKRKSSFNELFAYLNKNGGFMIFLSRAILFFLGVYGIVQLIRFLIKGKKYMAVTCAHKTLRG